jgi:hypothetical protein
VKEVDPKTLVSTQEALNTITKPNKTKIYRFEEDRYIVSYIFRICVE